MSLAGPATRVLAVDLPGHGRSEGRPPDSVAGYRAFLDAFTGHLGLTSPYLGGHSLGGAIALDYALARPGMLSGLILAGTGARLKVNPAILEAFAAGRSYPELVDLLYGREAAPLFREGALAEMEAVDPATWYADFSACNAFDVMDGLSRIDVRTLILVGDADRLTPPKYARYLADHIPGATYVLIPDAGHMLMVENPAAFNEAVADFLRIDRGGALL